MRLHASKHHRHAVPAADRPAPARTAARRAGAVIGTLGAAAVVGTALASTADAAPTYRVWDRVAHCESTNNWHINTGNGFYGGLQFSAGTWGAYGGHKYARQASGASRLQQIEVARRVLASQGPGAWPVCGPRAGLTRSSGQATHAPLPRIAGQVTYATARPAHQAKHHAKRTHHKAHHVAKSRAYGKIYRVHSGDTLARIAHRYHVAGGWHALYRANRSHMSNPNLIYVGQVLRLP